MSLEGPSRGQSLGGLWVQVPEFVDRKGARVYAWGRGVRLLSQGVGC